MLICFLLNERFWGRLKSHATVPLREVGCVAEGDGGTESSLENIGKSRRKSRGE